MSGGLNPPDRLHQGVPHYDADICSGVAVRLLSQGDKVCFCQVVGGGAQVKSEHGGASVLLWQRNVDSLFKPKGNWVLVRKPLMEFPSASIVAER